LSGPLTGPKGLFCSVTVIHGLAATAIHALALGCKSRVRVTPLWVESRGVAGKKARMLPACCVKWLMDNDVTV